PQCALHSFPTRRSSDLLQIKSGRYAPSFDLGIQPIERKAAVDFVTHIDSLTKMEDTAYFAHPYWHKIQLSHADQYHLQKMLADNAEWTPEHQGFQPSKNPFLKTFYQDKANLYKVDVPDFFLSVNPLLRLQAGSSNTDDKIDYITTRGVEVRGMIA